MPELTDQERVAIVTSFAEELSDWRNRNPGWTHSQQLGVFTTTRLLYRAKGDNELYERLMRIAGYQLTKEDLPAKR